jgi:AcrR family transcriptional regulator
VSASIGRMGRPGDGAPVREPSGKPWEGPPQHHAGRPRDTAIDRALIRATLRTLEEDGYVRLSMMGVAKRAGVSVAALYRRWSSKEDLVVTALESLRPGEKGIDTGSLRGDLTAMLHQLAAALEGEPGKLLRGLVGEAVKSPEFAVLIAERLGGAQRQRFAEVVDRAVLRGELPPVDPEVAMNLIAGPAIHRFLIEGAPVTPAVVDYLVPMIVAGLQAAPRPRV